MEQEENHEKGSGWSWGQKPNGKSQFMSSLKALEVEPEKISSRLNSAASDRIEALEFNKRGFYRRGREVGNNALNVITGQSSAIGGAARRNWLFGTSARISETEKSPG